MLPGLGFYDPVGDHNQQLINSLSERPGGVSGESEHKSKSRAHQRSLDKGQHVDGVKLYRSSPERD